MARRTLPENLYTTKAKGKTYYRYRLPDGTFRGMGSNKPLAIAAARQLNERLYGDEDLVTKVMPTGPSVRTHLAWFREVRLPQLNFAKNTNDLYGYRLAQLDKLFGLRPVSQVTVKELSEAMDTMTPTVAGQFRQVAIKFFATAVARGLRNDNPASATLIPKPVVKRQRLTLETYQWVYEHSEDWMQNLMDLAIITLQRRNDLLAMETSNIKDGVLYVIQEKTKKYNTGYLAIRIGASLQAVLERCDAYPMKGPNIIRRRPVRTRAWAGQTHISQPSPSSVTRYFTQLINECPYVQHLTPEQRPTFHEIRGLGIKRYRDAGKDPQQLAGHASAEMTNNYDAGHADIRWTQVTADLEIPCKDSKS